MKRWSRLIPIAIIAVGIVSVVYGVSQGEALIVYQKAARVCLECIGIG